jgi:4-amino-4-deoxy-L-arabinose transferase-like glycosyltransferase
VLKATADQPTLRRDALALAAVIGLSGLAWGIIFLAIPPGRQNFPLLDDWAYSAGAFEFASGGGVHFHRWAAMPLLGQWLWAAPFIRAFGQSHVVLRLSTILLSWLGLSAFYDLLRGSGHGPRSAALATATLAASPLFFVLQGTFMTDVPALSFALLALACYKRAMSIPMSSGAVAWRIWVWLGAVWAVLGVLTRQNTMAVPLAVALQVWSDRRTRSNFEWHAALALPIIAGVVAAAWIARRPDAWQEYRSWIAPPHLVLLLPFVTALLLGLLALPTLAAEPPHYSALCLAAIIGMAIAALYWAGMPHLLSEGGKFPYWDGILTQWGVYSGVTVEGTRPVLMGEPVRWAVSVVGCLAGAWLLVRAYRNWRLDDGTGALVLMALLQLPLILARDKFFDRYLLLLLPAALALVSPAQRPSGRRLLTGGLALVLMWGFSIAIVHDWLAWNSALWTLGNRTVRQGTDAWDIEGGFEWDAAHAPENPWQHFPDKPGFQLPMTKGHFPHVRGRVAIAFSADSYPVLDQERYIRWLPPGACAMYLIREAQPTRR